MTFTAFGRVNQPAPGTPVQLSTNLTLRVTRLFFQIVPGLTGKGYIGNATMNKTTLANVGRVLVPGTATNPCDQFEVETDSGYDGINLCEYYIDMDNAGEGLLVSYWTE